MYQQYTKSEFGIYKSNYLNGSYKLSKASHFGADQELLKQFILLHIERKELDVWQVQDEFEFALLLTYHELDYKNFLPEDIHYPIHIYFKRETTGDPSEPQFQVVLLEYLIAAFGGYDNAKQIVANKPSEACAFLMNFHRYYGYSFGNNDWYKPELNKPLKQRVCQLYPISDIRKAVTFLRPDRNL